MDGRAVNFPSGASYGDVHVEHDRAWMYVAPGIWRSAIMDNSGGWTLDKERQARIEGDNALGLRIDAVEDSITEGGGFVDAPNDGKLYGRQLANWAEVPEGGVSDWADIENKPDSFPPESHTHNYLSDAPSDGNQYARKDGGWSEVEATGDGGDANDSRISDTQIANWDTSFSWGEDDGRITDLQIAKWDASANYGDHSTQGYITTEEDPVFAASPAAGITSQQISDWDAGTGGGGSGGNDPRISDTDITHWSMAYAYGNHADEGYATQAWVNGKSYATQSWVSGQSYATQTWVNGKSYATTTWVSSNYQAKGNYSLTNHNHTGVYQPAGNYATTSYAYSKAESDTKYQLKGAAAGFSGTYSASTSAVFTMTGSDKSAFTAVSTTSARGCELKLQGNSTTNTMHIRASKTGNLEVVNGAYSAVTWAVNSSGDMTATGDVRAYSDERLKENIEVVGAGLLDKVRGVEFNWKKNGKKSSGVIAQDIQKVFPHLVNESAGTDPDDREEGTLTVNYAGLTAYLIEELKDCRRRIAVLEESQQ